MGNSAYDRCKLAIVPIILLILPSSVIQLLGGGAILYTRRRIYEHANFRSKDCYMCAVVAIVVGKDRKGVRSNYYAPLTKLKLSTPSSSGIRSQESNFLTEW